jgi:RNA polymerase sigma-70 factor (ECF subfamily)
MDLNETQLKKALNGDINSFQSLFSAFQNQLKSYLYRLLADRNDAEDFTHDTFVKAFDKISTFKGESSLKTWVFQIATNMAYDYLRKKRRWGTDAQDIARTLASGSDEIKAEFNSVHNNSPYGNYEIKEHIDFCFTCISKTLIIEQQLALILKDIYDFSVNETATIMNSSVGVIKHLLIDSRKNMTTIFDNRCALINKNGTCHQCSELNGFFNPKQNQQQAIVELDLVKLSNKFNKEELFNLRATLIKSIDPLRSNGADLQDVIMKCTRKSIGEINQN